MMRKLAIAAGSLAVGGTVVLLAVTGTAGAGAPTPPSSSATSVATTTSSAAAGHRDTDAKGPRPTATASATSGPGSTSGGSCGGDAGTTGSAPPLTVVVTPGALIPGGKPTNGSPVPTAPFTTGK